MRFVRDNEEHYQKMQRMAIARINVHSDDSLGRGVFAHSEHNCSSLFERRLREVTQRVATRKMKGNEYSLDCTLVDTECDFEVRRIFVTPTRVIACPPEIWPTNSLFFYLRFEMDRLIMVSFVTETFKPMNFEEMKPSEELGFLFKHFVFDGESDGRLTIWNRNYQFLFATNEMYQLRTLCFLEPRTSSAALVGMKPFQFCFAL